MDRPTIDVQAKYVTASITTPANTGPTSTAFQLGQRTLEHLDVFWAPGASGLVGLAVQFAGVTLLPWNQPGSFLFGDGERRIFEMGIQLGGSITLVTNNADILNPHTLVITAKLTEYDVPGNAPQVQLIDLVGGES